MQLTSPPFTMIGHEQADRALQLLEMLDVDSTQDDKRVAEVANIIRTLVQPAPANLTH